MAIPNTSNSQNPTVPEYCKVHQATIEELTENQGKLVGELDGIRKTFVSEIGLSPDPLNPDHPNGSGLKGLLCQILNRLDGMDKRLDELSRASATPSAPTVNDSVVKKVASWLLILYLAASQVPTLYASIKGASASQVPSTSVGVK